MGTTEAPVAPPQATVQPQVAIVQKVPRYRRLDMQCVAQVRKLDPGSVKTGDLPERIQRLAQNVFLESADVYAPGSYVGFELNVTGRDLHYTAKGVVRWISDDPKGFGLQLFEVASEKASESQGGGAEVGAGSPSGAPAPAEARESAFSLPAPETLSELLSGLLGKTIAATPCAKWDPQPDTPAAVASFGPDDGPTCCLWIFDMAASIYSGAALTMIPSDEAKQAVEAKELRESFLENVREIFNVGSSLFNNTSSAHLKLKETFVTSQDLPESVRKIMAQPVARLDLDVDVPDYGKGRISVMVA